jgi:hypothetical protein
VLFSTARSICLSAEGLAVEPGCGVALVTDDEVGVDAVSIEGVSAVEDAARKARIADAPALTSG